MHLEYSWWPRLLLGVCSTRPPTLPRTRSRLRPTSLASVQRARSAYLASTRTGHTPDPRVRRESLLLLPPSKGCGKVRVCETTAGQHPAVVLFCSKQHSLLS